MSAQRDEAFKQWKNGFIRHYEPLTSVEAFVGGWNSRDATSKQVPRPTRHRREWEMKTYLIDLLFFGSLGVTFGVWQDSLAAGLFAYLLINFIDAKVAE